MKLVVLVLSLLSGGSSVFAQSCLWCKDSFEIRTTITYSYANGKVVQEKHWGGDKMLLNATINYRYTASGLLDSTIYGIRQAIGKNTYNNDFQLVSQNWVAWNGTMLMPSSKDTFFYNGNGLLVKKVRFGSNGLVLSDSMYYDANGNLVRQNYYDSVGVLKAYEMFSYDSLLMIKKQDIFYGNNKVSQFGELQYYKIYKYDSNKVVISEKKYKPDSTLIYTYSYQNFYTGGNITEIKQWQPFTNNTHILSTAIKRGTTPKSLPEIIADGVYCDDINVFVSDTLYLTFYNYNSLPLDSLKISVNGASKQSVATAPFLIKDTVGNFNRTVLSFVFDAPIEVSFWDGRGDSVRIDAINDSTYNTLSFKNNRALISLNYSNPFSYFDLRGRLIAKTNIKKMSNAVYINAKKHTLILK